MTAARLPRHQRAESPPPMQLTDRDLRILRLIADFRYMTREQVEKLEFSPSTASYCKRRLMLLYQHGYLDRRFLPLRSAFGAARAYYTLDRRGAFVLAEVFELPRWQIDWRPRDGRREPLYMEHTLRINDFRVLAILAAQRAALEFAWTDERDLKRRANELRVVDPLKTSERITVIPDSYFTLAGRWSFALELDRGTVEEGPFKRKIRGYGELKTTGVYEEAFGTKSLRVLWVVVDSSRDSNRLQRILSWAATAGGGTMFWFTAFEDFMGNDPLHRPIWSVARRQGTYALFEEKRDEPLEHTGRDIR